MKNIDFILKVMEYEARRKNAPLFMFVKETKSTPFQILISTVLSSRTKDEKTMAASRRLFSRAKNPRALLRLSNKKIEKLIYGVGFYRTKAKTLRKLCKALIDRYGGEVPKSLDELLSLPGVGRKTANIVLARAFGMDTLGVDTHVHRIANRLGLVRTKKPEATERKLLQKIPKKYIRKLNAVFVAYGQTICLPVSPWCSICKLNKICPQIGVKQRR